MTGKRGSELVNNVVSFQIIWHLFSTLFGVSYPGVKAPATSYAATSGCPTSPQVRQIPWKIERHLSGKMADKSHGRPGRRPRWLLLIRGSRPPLRPCYMSPLSHCDLHAKLSVISCELGRISWELNATGSCSAPVRPPRCGIVVILSILIAHKSQPQTLR